MYSIIISRLLVHLYPRSTARAYLAACALALLASCGGSSSSSNGTESSARLEDGSQFDNIGLFKVDTAIADLGGVAPTNTVNTEATESSDYLSGLQFVDDNGVGIEFLHQNSNVLEALNIQTGVEIDGFDSDALATDGFISVVYPDEFVGDRLVELTTSTASRLVVYYPNENLYEVLPSSRNDSNALEAVLPELSKQTFFALMFEEALAE